MLTLSGVWRVSRWTRYVSVDTPRSPWVVHVVLGLASLVLAAILLNFARTARVPAAGSNTLQVYGTCFTASLPGNLSESLTVISAAWSRLTVKS
jgi:hypothetical protein